MVRDAEHKYPPTSNADPILVVDFYNQINLLYGSITEFCSPQTCPEMKATDELVILTNGTYLAQT